MDFLLPVAPRLGIYQSRHWRDIQRSEPIEIAQIDQEPVSLDDAKSHLSVDDELTDDDLSIAAIVSAARRQVETDLNRTLVKTTLEMTFDQFPIERWIPLPRPPFVSLTTFTWFDLLTGVEAAVDATTYFLDTTSQPGRVILVPGQVWPTGVRWQQGGKIRWIAGYTTAMMPPRYVHAIKLLAGSWYKNREAGDVMRGTPEVYPLGYESLVSDRLESFG